jgi:hypothetical protein
MPGRQRVVATRRSRGPAWICEEQSPVPHRQMGARWGERKRSCPGCSLSERGNAHAPWPSPLFATSTPFSFILVSRLGAIAPHARINSAFGSNLSLCAEYRSIGTLLQINSALSFCIPHCDGTSAGDRSPAHRSNGRRGYAVIMEPNSGGTSAGTACSTTGPSSGYGNGDTFCNGPVSPPSAHAL